MGFRALLRSGNANNGANAGFAYLNTNNSASTTNANIGAQLSINTLSTPIDHASWQKTTITRVMLVSNERFALINAD
jgi:hypothetical protein